MTVIELMEKRKKTWEAAKAFVNSHEDANGRLSAEDTETYNRMESEIQDLTDAINRQTHMEQLDKQLSKPVTEPLTGKPGKTADENKTGRASSAYKDAMLTAFRTNFRTVSNILQEGIDANGGYLVPEEYDNRLIDTLNEENIMRKLGTVRHQWTHTSSMLQSRLRRSYSTIAHSILRTT